MRPILAPIVLLVATAALSGCIQDSTLGVAHAGAGAGADSAGTSLVTSGGTSHPWSETLDLRTYLREDRVALVAYQALEDLSVEVRMDKDLSYKEDGVACSLGSIRPHAPVDYLIDLANNRGGTAPEYQPDGPWSAGKTGGGVLSATLDGQPLFESQEFKELPLPENNVRATTATAMDLEEGEWFLVTAGLYGLHPNDLADDSSWTVAVEASAGMRRITLSDTELFCGLGFDDHARTRVAAVAVDPSADASWEGDYAANLRIQSTEGAADGYFEFGGERIPLRADMDVQRFAWGGERAGFEVSDPGDLSVFWVFQGV